MPALRLPLGAPALLIDSPHSPVLGTSAPVVPFQQTASDVPILADCVTDAELEALKHITDVAVLMVQTRLAFARWATLFPGNPYAGTGLDLVDEVPRG